MSEKQAPQARLKSKQRARQACGGILAPCLAAVLCGFALRKAPLPPNVAPRHWLCLERAMPVTAPPKSRREVRNEVRKHLKTSAADHIRLHIEGGSEGFHHYPAMETK